MPPVLPFEEPHLYLLVYPLTAPEQKLYELDLTSSLIVNSCIPRSNLKPSSAPDESNWNATGVFFLDANETLLYTFGGFKGVDCAQMPYLCIIRRRRVGTLSQCRANLSILVIGMMPCPPALWAAIKA